MHITPELEAELNAEQTTDKNADDFSSFSAMLKARYGAGETCNYEEAYQAYCRDMQANQVAQAVDKVLDGIDAAKVRDQVIECLDKLVLQYQISYTMHDNNTCGIADELLKQFIIMPRS